MQRERNRELVQVAADLLELQASGSKLDDSMLRLERKMIRMSSAREQQVPLFEHRFKDQRLFAGLPRRLFSLSRQSAAIEDLRYQRNREAG